VIGPLPDVLVPVPLLLLELEDDAQEARTTADAQATADLRIVFCFTLVSPLSGASPGTSGSRHQLMRPT
jgi:hypothetical protein